MNHKLKTLSEYFQATVDRKKNFEVRKNDRDYQVGDTLTLQEYNLEEGYTGRERERRVNYILDNPEYVKEGYVILGME